MTTPFKPLQDPFVLVRGVSVTQAKRIFETLPEAAQAAARGSHLPLARLAAALRANAQKTGARVEDILALHIDLVEHLSE